MGSKVCKAYTNKKDYRNRFSSKRNPLHRCAWIGKRSLGITLHNLAPFDMLDVIYIVLVEVYI